MTKANIVLSLSHLRKEGHENENENVKEGMRRETTHERNTHIYLTCVFSPSLTPSSVVHPLPPASSRC